MTPQDPALNFEFDLFVIGGGSGGVRAARQAAARGARVALAEAHALGGTCVNVGCIPKKIYSYAASLGSAVRFAAGYGWNCHIEGFDWEHLKRQRTAEVTRLNGVYGRLLAGSEVALFQGWARIVGPHTVKVNDRLVSARHILLAPGATPVKPDMPGVEHCITSDQIFDLPRLPKRMVVVGSGYIACEFASIFSGLGVEIDLLYRRDRLLADFDAEAAAFLATELQRAGVRLHPHTSIDSVSEHAGQKRVSSRDGREFSADEVLLAIGRAPNIHALGLDGVGIRLSAQGAILVDQDFRTSVPSIRAVGDAIARAQLTPVALAEGMEVVDILFPGPHDRRRVPYHCIPTAIFTDPALACCGLTEEQAREKHGKVVIYKTDFRTLKATIAGDGGRTFMKLIVAPESDLVLGLHMVGQDAGEIVQGFAVAIQKGVTKQEFDATVGIHPTVAEEFVTMRQPSAS